MTNTEMDQLLIRAIESFGTDRPFLDFVWMRMCRMSKDARESMCSADLDLAVRRARSAGLVGAEYVPAALSDRLFLLDD